jgi:hypothetical protein
MSWRAQRWHSVTLVGPVGVATIADTTPGRSRHAEHTGPPARSKLWKSFSMKVSSSKIRIGDMSTKSQSPALRLLPLCVVSVMLLTQYPRGVFQV